MEVKEPPSAGEAEPEAAAEAAPAEEAEEEAAAAAHPGMAAIPGGSRRAMLWWVEWRIYLHASLFLGALKHLALHRRVPLRMPLPACSSGWAHACPCCCCS